MVTTKIPQSYSRCVKLLPIKFYVRIRFTNRNILDCYLLDCDLSFVMSHNLLFFGFCKTSKKQHFRFSVVFSSEKCLNLDL